MNNYVYIVSSLPVISKDPSKNQDIDDGALLEDIREQLVDSDREVLDFFLEAFEPDNLTEEFYRKATSHRNRFIRMFAAMDLSIRNAKARYLNDACGRPTEMDTIRLSEVEESAFEQAAELHAILHGSDILAREKGLDQLMWDYVSGITVFNYFDMDAILAFVVKFKISMRWLKLEPQTGRQMFRTLVDEVRSTFKGVEF